MTGICTSGAWWLGRFIRCRRELLAGVGEAAGGLVEGQRKSPGKTGQGFYLKPHRGSLQPSRRVLPEVLPIVLSRIRFSA